MSEEGALRMMRRTIVATAGFLLCLCALPAGAQGVSGRVASVASGDTLMIQFASGLRVRLRLAHVAREPVAFPSDLDIGRYHLALAQAAA